MGSKVKALIWEECRVGGTIAALCLFGGLLLLLDCRYSLGPDAWLRDSFFVGSAVIGAPMFTAMLLILNPDYSGHLVGGFSERILRLPTPTAIAVGIALGARAIFVFLTALILALTSMHLLNEAPGLDVVYAITIFYLLAQTIDWLRASLSGLSSLLVLCVFGLMIPEVMHRLRELQDVALAWSPSPLVLPAALAAVATSAYVFSFAGVRAQRIGKYFGVPEIWEWPKNLTLPGLTPSKPFASPLSAQVWFELRRTAWILPAATLFFWFILGGAYWLYTDGYQSAADQNDYFPTGSGALSFIVFAAVLLAAAAQGLSVTIMGFGSTPRKPNYDHLLPLTDAQMAYAHTLAMALSLIPTLAIATALHFVVAGGFYLAEMVQRAWEFGVISPRELVWTIVSRGLLTGVVAWTLLAAGTRLFRRIAGAVLAVSGVLLLMLTSRRFVSWLDSLPDPEGRLNESIALVYDCSPTVILIVLIATTISLFSYARKHRIIPRRSALSWIVIWALTAWLFQYPLTVVWLDEAIPVDYLFTTALTAIACSAPVPLAYLAVLFDVRRRRHNAARPQDPAQHVRFRTPAARPLSLVGTACLVLALLWLGWPSSSAYERFRRDRGYPVSLAELDAWYPEPPPEENFSDEYSAATKEQLRRVDAYYKRLLELDSEMDGIKDYVDISTMVNEAELPGDQPVESRMWNRTEQYWSNVTAYVAPMLREIATHETRNTRYPIDLRDGKGVALPHLSKLRSLGRELRLDALHWSVASEPERAADGILAIVPIANSLSNEPILISQLVRLPLAASLETAIESSLRRSEFTLSDLARLQRACRLALPDAGEGMAVDRAFVGETTQILNLAIQEHDVDGFQIRGTASPAALVAELVFPVAAERMTAGLRTEKLAREGIPAWSELRRRNEDPARYSNAFTSPLFMVLFPPMERAYEVEWLTRMRLATARAGLAVERFRLTYDRLPTDLEELVPEFLAEVPEDYFGGPGVPIRYRVRDDGEYVVYSVGRDGEDDEGVEMERAYSEGDIAFTVAPVSVRRGPHIVAE